MFDSLDSLVREQYGDLHIGLHEPVFGQAERQAASDVTGLLDNIEWAAATVINLPRSVPRDH